jgi:DNA-binding protein H-NS
VLEDIPEYSKKRMKFRQELRKIHKKYKDDIKKQVAYEQKYRNNEVKNLIFEDTLRQSRNAKTGQKSITAFFK